MTATERLLTGRSSEFSDQPAGAMTLVQTQTLLADATSVTFSGLDGDVDGIYFIFISLLKGAAGVVGYDLLPNGLGTNGSSVLLLIGGAVQNNATIRFIYGGGNIGDTLTAVLQMMAHTGFQRDVQVQGTQWNAGTTYQLIGAGTWAETVTNITSLVLQASVADGFKAGSVFSLYKIKQ
jgi:hypothetical protein